MPTNLQLLEKANRAARLFAPGQSIAKTVDAPARVQQVSAVPAPSVNFRYQPQFLDLANQLLSPKHAGESFSVGICPVRGEDSIGRFVAFLGASMSQLSNSPILLIETDFRRPCLARYLGVPATPGLREMIAPAPQNRFDCIHATRYRNLHLLPAGNRGSGEGPRNLKRGLEWIYGMVSKRFPSVIIAFPAWNEQPGIHSSYALADAMLLAVTPGSCRSLIVRRAVRRLRKAKANLTGAVLSDLER